MTRDRHMAHDRYVAHGRKRASQNTFEFVLKAHG